MQASDQAIVTALQTAITGWLAALAADSANPQPSYTLSGPTGTRSVDRNAWRKDLLDSVLKANDRIVLLQQRQPASFRLNRINR